jgi:hypothetical protein
MKLKMKAALIVIVFQLVLLEITTCVPVASKDEAKSSEKITEESGDPCDLMELENISNCADKDDECSRKNEENDSKRKEICLKHPNCSYCETNGNSSNIEVLEVDPEIVAPIGESHEALDELRSPSQKLIERNIIIENDNETHFYRGFIESGANITTVIRLTNLIKNENIINMPTTLNNTNINNIHIYHNKTSEEGGKFGLGFNEDGPCCFAVEPKVCKQSTAGTKCRHKKKKVCGHQCTSKIIHPKKNSCSYTATHIICPNNQYQPGFYPPPAFYPSSNPAFFPPGFPGFVPQNPPSLDEFDDDEDLPLFPEDDLLKNPESGWVVGPEKCKIVSEDGLQIFNCTNKGIDFEHPFARNSESESIRRDVRHAGHPQSPQMLNQGMPQAPYYPVIPVVVMQPMPFYVPQYYPQQPPMNYYQPHQIPQPPIADRESFLENDDTNEINSYQKPRRHSRKHHPIVMDEEL